MLFEYLARIVDDNNLIEKSKKLQEESTKYGFEFIDTSFNRKEVIEKSIEKMIKDGKLDRTDKSYERYYR